MGKVYPEDVKRKAVELYRLDPETTYAEVGRDLGISGETIRNWCRQGPVVVLDRARVRAAWSLTFGVLRLAGPPAPAGHGPRTRPAAAARSDHRRAHRFEGALRLAAD